MDEGRILNDEMVYFHIMTVTQMSFERLAQHHLAVQYGVAVAAVTVASVLCRLFVAQAGYQSVSLVLLFTVAVLSLNLSTGPVLVSAMLSALVWNFFFIPPHFTFAITQPQDVLMFVAYFVVAAITGILTTRIRSREKLASALYTLTKDLNKASSQDDVAHVAVKCLGDFFTADVVIYLSTLDGEINAASHPSSTIVPDQKEFSVASWAYWNEKKAGRFVDVLPFSRCTYYPVSGPRYPLAVIGVSTKNNKTINREQEELLQNFIEQIASALEREQLNELAKRTVLYAESEKLHRTLFNSISHELRTPLSAIIGAAESLSRNYHPETASEIRQAADRLNRLVENLLDMSRLESGQLAPSLDWCDINDLFRASVHKLKDDLAGHTVSITVPQDMPLVQLDFVLMDQVLTNILYNAAVYTPFGSAIVLTASFEQQRCIITVSDNGPGIPSDSIDHLFHKFYRVPGSKTGGTGLGLSIAKGFVEAHKGTISVRNRVPNGTEFIISIPTAVPVHYE